VQIPTDVDEHDPHSKNTSIFFSQRNATLNFRSTEQDVLALLGPPSQIFYKQEDKMKIYTASYTGLLN
jgi:hypothetical protein